MLYHATSTLKWVHHNIIPEQGEGYNSVPIELFCPWCVCMHAKSVHLAHFQHTVSLGCCKPLLANTGPIRCLPNATQVWTYSLPVLGHMRTSIWCFNVDFLRTLLAMAAIVSLAYAHVHCYPTVNEFCRKRPMPFLPLGSHCGLWVWSHCGLLIMWVWILHNKCWCTKRGEVHYSVSLIIVQLHDLYSVTLWISLYPSSSVTSCVGLVAESLSTRLTQHKFMMREVVST